jgi:hypothetical protein
VARNRAARRAQRRRWDPRFAVERVRTLPGLPGGAPFVSAEEQERVVEGVLDAVGAMRPVMAWNRTRRERGLPTISVRLRRVTELAPGGLGRGVVLVEVTAARERVERPSLILPGVLELPGEQLRAANFREGQRVVNSRTGEEFIVKARRP